MARAEQDHLELRFNCSFDFFFFCKDQCDGSAAALAEGIAEREAALALRLAGEQHLARDLERGVLEVAAADGAARFAGAQPHARAGLARRRAASLDDQDFNHALHGWP